MVIMMLFSRKIILVLSCLFPFAAYAAQIEKIYVSGQHNLSSDAVIRYSEVNYLQSCSANLEKAVSENLYATKLFEQIQVICKNNVLSIEVTEVKQINAKNIDLINSNIDRNKKALSPQMQDYISNLEDSKAKKVQKDPSSWSNSYVDKMSKMIEKNNSRIFYPQKMEKIRQHNK